MVASLRSLLNLLVIALLLLYDNAASRIFSESELAHFATILETTSPQYFNQLAGHLGRFDARQMAVITHYLKGHHSELVTKYNDVLHVRHLRFRFGKSGQSLAKSRLHRLTPAERKRAEIFANRVRRTQPRSREVGDVPRPSRFGGRRRRVRPPRRPVVSRRTTTRAPRRTQRVTFRRIRMTTPASDTTDLFEKVDEVNELERYLQLLPDDKRRSLTEVFDGLKPGHKRVFAEFLRSLTVQQKHQLLLDMMDLSVEDLRVGADVTRQLTNDEYRALLELTFGD